MPTCKITSVTFGGLHGKNFREVEEQTHQFNAVVVFPGSDVDRKVELGDHFQEDIGYLYQAAFPDGKCVPPKSALIDLYDKISMMACVHDAGINVLPWRILERAVFER
jgi:hypothetical protein